MADPLPKTSATSSDGQHPGAGHTNQTTARIPLPQTTGAYLDSALCDSEQLLAYAATAGIDVNGADRDAIIAARALRAGGWTSQSSAAFLAALTRIAGALKPVTAETLEACKQSEAVAKEIRGYRTIAIVLTLIIVPFSCLSFVTSGISDAIRKDIVSANELAVKATTQLAATAGGTSAGAPSSPGGRNATAADRQPSQVSQTELTTLQQFAGTIRAIDARSLQLNGFLVLRIKDPFESSRGKDENMSKIFELPVPLGDPKEAADQKIATYQKVRHFAQSVLDTTSVLYGAATTCVLPALYAMLGACAYLIRSFEQQVKARTFAPSKAHSARFVIAGIGGAVVGLFNNFSVSQGASIPPLALAFLVGYAVDVFFSFLDGLLQTFTKGRSSPAV